MKKCFAFLTAIILLFLQLGIFDFSVNRRIIQTAAAETASGTENGVMQSDLETLLRLSGQYRAEKNPDAIRLYEIAAGLGSVEAMECLGDIYYLGELTEPDFEKAAGWYKKAADLGSTHAMNFLGTIYLSDNMTDYKQAEIWFQKSADAGDTTGMYNLASMYWSEKYGMTDIDKAEKYLLLSAEKGSVRSQYWLASLYHSEYWGRYDIQKAITWYQAAADQNYIDAILELGNIYRQGEGGSADLPKAMELYEKAASLDNIQAMEWLIYLLVTSGEADSAQTEEWIEKAIERGSGFAMYERGMLLRQKANGDSDMAQVREWLEKAVDAGYGKAQDELDKLNEASSDSGTSAQAQTGTESSEIQPIESETEIKSPEVSFLRDPDAIERTAQSILKLYTLDENGDLLAMASGVVLFDNMTLVTSYHVIEKAHQIIAESDDENQYRIAGMIAADQDRDLAILRFVSPTASQPLEMSTTPLRRGEEIMAIGSPLGLMNTVSVGIISAVRDEYTIQFSAPISNESSGGALLNADGKVIGITTAPYDNGQNLNFAVAASAVLDLFNSWDGTTIHSLEDSTEAETTSDAGASSDSNTDYESLFIPSVFAKCYLDNWELAKKQLSEGGYTESYIQDAEKYLRLKYMDTDEGAGVVYCLCESSGVSILFHYNEVTNPEQPSVMIGVVLSYEIDEFNNYYDYATKLLGWTISDFCHSISVTDLVEWLESGLTEEPLVIDDYYEVMCTLQDTATIFLIYRENPWKDPKTADQRSESTLPSAQSDNLSGSREQTYFGGGLINQYACTIGNQTNVRFKKDRQAEVVDQLEKGAYVYLIREELDEQGDSWVLIKYKYGYGYVPAQGLELTSEAKEKTALHVFLHFGWKASDLTEADADEISNLLTQP